MRGVNFRREKRGLGGKGEIPLVEFARFEGEDMRRWMRGDCASSQAVFAGCRVL